MEFAAKNEAEQEVAPSERPSVGHTSPVAAPTEAPSIQVAGDTDVAARADTEAIPESKGTKEIVEEAADELDKLKIHGGKSLDELHAIQSKRSHLSAGILFTDPSLKIPAPILESLTVEMRFEKPSEIQASTLPIILDGHNLIAQAQSGAGKTIAFVIGMLAKINPNLNQVQALCLAPTRELAIQILTDAVAPLSSKIPGLRYEGALKGTEVPKGAVSSAHIVVGTPGSVRGWISSGYLRLETIKIFVLDEADTMVEQKKLGADTLQIKSALQPGVQILLFSATYEKAILDYARRIVPRAYMVTPRSTEELVLDVIFQVRMNIPVGGKLQVLKDIYDFLTMQQSIIFVEMKREADNVSQLMRSEGYEVSTLHGELDPAARDQVMNDFRAGKTKVLITTNVLARGVDVPAVAVVVNFDMPVKRMGQRVAADESTYLHRIGRCGRFGRKGTAINFLEKPQDSQMLEDIERFYRPDGQRMTTEWDVSDVEGLSSAIKSRPAGGEILPEAMKGSSNDGDNAPVRITEFKGNA